MILAVEIVASSCAHKMPSLKTQQILFQIPTTQKKHDGDDEFAWVLLDESAA